MKKGQLFTAYHKNLGTINYKYIGAEQTSNGYNIHLVRLDNGSDTYVEPAWFTTRVIKEVF